MNYNYNMNSLDSGMYIITNGIEEETTICGQRTGAFCMCALLRLTGNSAVRFWNSNHNSGPEFSHCKINKMKGK